MDAITAEMLSKSYDGTRFALKNLSVSIPYGSIYGFLGPNGAGKTTTVKLMTGLIRPDVGICLVGGADPAKEPDRVHAICGVITETARPYGSLTGMQNLCFFGETCGLKPADAARRAEVLLRRLDLWDAREKLVSAYSTGMAQRISLARALMHRPRVLFLDEPTSGLDPESAKSVNSLLREQAEQEGAAVFLCTHQLRYAQDLCGLFGILENGALLTGGSLPDLRQEAACRMQVKIRLGPDDGLDGFQTRDGWQICEINREDEMPGLLRRIVENGHNVYEARLERASLEDVYFALTRRGGGENYAGKIKTREGWGDETSYRNGKGCGQKGF